MAVVWPEAREYVIYIASPTEAGDWEKLTEGVGTAVVWAAADSTFAVLYAPQAAAPDVERSSKWKNKGRDLERQTAAAIAMSNANRSSTVQVRPHIVHSVNANLLWGESNAVYLQSS